MFRLSKFSHIKKLSGLYALTVLAISTLTIGGQIVTQRSLHSQLEDDRIINVAGRQRMLSQRVAKTAHVIASNNASLVSEKALIEELLTSLHQLEQAHRSLQFGSFELGLTQKNSPVVANLFADIEMDYQVLTEAATTLLNAASSGEIEDRFSPEILTSIDEGERGFLPKMDAIVAQYEQEAVAKLNRLRAIQKTLLILTLLALLPVSWPLSQTARQINKMVAAMQRAGVEVSSSSFHISTSGKQLETMVTEQAAASAQITASSQKIASTALVLNQQVEQVMRSAVHTQDVAERGSADIASMMAIIKQIDQVTSAMATKLETIRDRANAIDQVVVAMTKVADQTNLLSLNAAIEAEKAGDYGAGFSVVAREIRRLADQTAIAALDIDGLVKEMQSAVSVGSTEVGRFTQQVSEGTENAKGLTQQVTAITEQIQSFLPQLAAVNVGIEAQSSSAAQIRDAMEQLSAGTGQTVQALRETNGALEQLQNAAMRLKQEKAIA